MNDRTELTIWDRAALAALQGLLAQDMQNRLTGEAVVREAVRFADAFVAEREVRMKIGDLNAVTLINDFHHTETVVRPDENGTIGSDEALTAWRALCGQPGCGHCGQSGIRGGVWGLQQVKIGLFTRRYRIVEQNYGPEGARY